MTLQFRSVICCIGVAALVFSACARNAGPKETLRDYFTALAEGNPLAAFELLTGRARQALDALAERSGAGLSGSDVFRQRVTTGGPAAVPWITPTTVDRLRIDILKEDGDTAVLKVTSPVGGGDVRMLREGGAWRVDLDV
jgi:hypothetical protein